MGILRNHIVSVANRLYDILLHAILNRMLYTVATVGIRHNSLAAAKPSQFCFYELIFQKIMNKIRIFFGKQWKMDTKDANEIRLCAAGTSVGD